MFKVIPNGINRLDMEMSGKLNSEDMKTALDELVSKSKILKMAKCYMKLSTFVFRHEAQLEFNFLAFLPCSGL